VLLPAVYVSADELERALARGVGYRTVCAHPKEVGVVDVSELLAIDCNPVLVGDPGAAVAAAKDHAGRGGVVGLHTYDPDARELAGLRALPTVVVAKTHKQLLFKLGRHARVLKYVRGLCAQAARSLESEVKHVRKDVKP
jgi:hypothetical protein